MKKKLLAVAVGAALAAPLAANAGVTVGGELHLSLDYQDALVFPNFPSYEKVWNVSSNASNFFIKVEEDVGGGMTAFGFIQEYVRMDHLAGLGTSTGSGTAPLNGSYWFTNTRNSNRIQDGQAWVGLKGGFGSILLGSPDSPGKLNGRKADLFNNQIGDSRNLGMDNFRVQNTVSYSTPTLAGVTATLAHSTNVDNSLGGTDIGWYVYNGGGATGSGSAGTFAKMNMIGVNYSAGPLYVGVALDSIIPVGSYGFLPEQKYTNLAASYDVGPVSIKAAYQKREAASFNAAVEQKVMGLGVAYTMGKHVIKGQYYMLDDNRVNRDAKLMAVGYDYNFSKTTRGYVAYASVENDSTAAYSMAAGGHGDQPWIDTGADINGMSVGIVMKF